MSQTILSAGRKEATGWPGQGLIPQSVACDRGARVASAFLPCLGDSRGEQLGWQQERFRLDSETSFLTVRVSRQGERLLVADSGLEVWRPGWKGVAERVTFREA